MEKEIQRIEKGRQKEKIESKNWHSLKSGCLTIVNSELESFVVENVQKIKYTKSVHLSIKRKLNM